MEAYLVAKAANDNKPVSVVTLDPPQGNDANAAHRKGAMRDRNIAQTKLQQAEKALEEHDSAEAWFGEEAERTKQLAEEAQQNLADHKKLRAELLQLIKGARDELSNHSIKLDALRAQQTQADVDAGPILPKALSQAQITQLATKAGVELPTQAVQVLFEGMACILQERLETALGQQLAQNSVKEPEVLKSDYIKPFDEYMEEPFDENWYQEAEQEFLLEQQAWKAGADQQQVQNSASMSPLPSPTEAGEHHPTPEQVQELEVLAEQARHKAVPVDDSLMARAEPEVDKRKLEEDNKNEICKSANQSDQLAGPVKKHKPVEEKQNQETTEQMVARMLVEQQKHMDGMPTTSTSTSGVDSAMPASASSEDAAASSAAARSLG